MGTAIRQGAKSVHQYEIMPRPREWTKPWNPDWPEWPRILRTSISQEEGCVRDWNISKDSFPPEMEYHLNEAHFARVEWRYDGTKKRFEMREISGSEFSEKVDLVLLAQWAFCM